MKRMAAIVALGLGVVVLVAMLRPVDPEHPHTVSPEDLDTALASTDLPLSMATDVLLVIVCTLRRDRLEPYGHDRPSSPFLDRLANNGILFENNLTQAPWTRPSMGSIVTGRWPRTLKLDNPGKKGTLSMVLAPEHTTLAEALQEMDYATIGAVANPNLKAQFGFNQGFDAYLEPDTTYKDSNRNPLIEGSEVVDFVLDELGKVPTEQPVFARVVLADPHLPRNRVPYRLLRLFGGRSGDEDSDVNLYDAAVRTVDAHLARLFVEWKKQRPNLLMVVVADHGEGLRHPKHHGPGHGNHLYLSTIGGPSIWHHPAVAAGRRISALSMNIDVHPTILGLLGSEATTVDGADQAGLVMGKAETSPHSHAFAETFFKKAHKSAVFDGQHLLIRDHVGERTERVFAASDADALTELAPSLELSHQLTMWERTREADADAANDALEAAPDADTLEQLRAIGYTE